MVIKINGKIGTTPIDLKIDVEDSDIITLYEKIQDQHLKKTVEAMEFLKSDEHDLDI